MVRLLLLLSAICGLSAVALPARASAVGMSENYPREVASISTGEGVRLTRMEARIRRFGTKVRVTVRLAGASTAGTRRLTITAGPCTVTAKTYKESYDAPSRPTCRPGAPPQSATVTTAPFSIARSFTIPRPAARPGALRVGVSAKGSAAPPPCRGFIEVCGGRTTGELLLNGGTWTFEPGSWWGIVATPPAGVTVDRVLFRSRMGGWVATSATAARVQTTWGYRGETPLRKRATPLLAGAQKTLMVNSAPGGEFETRPVVRVLDYAAAIDGRRLFTATLPLPVWRSTYPR